MSVDVLTIVCGTDFSNASAEAVRYACDLTDKLGAELHLLHIIHDFAAEVPDYGEGLVFPGYLEHLAERKLDLEKAAARRLQGLVDDDWRARHKLTSVLRIGRPVDEILAYARKVKADMIVLGTHGRTGLAHALLGSVTEKVLRQAPCAVTVVPPTPR